jgi:glycerol-3-phosphate dehydrogenase
VVWEEAGLITVTGGKMTTFRIMAEQALQMAAAALPGHPDFSRRVRYFNPLPKANPPAGMSLKDWTYLMGRYSSETEALIAAAQAGELEHIAPLPNLWAEVRWAARCGGILHLDDLLLRRVRVGMLLPEGAIPQIEKIRSIAQPELGWSDSRWNTEVERYKKIYHAYYSPEPTGLEK